MTRPRPLLRLVPLLVLLLPGAAAAQPDGRLEVTVIVSDLGEGAPRGRLERRVAEAWEARQRGLGGIFGLEVDLTVRGDASDPERALRLVREAAADGAHAIVCCSTEAASARVAPYAAGAGVPLLSPAGAGVEAAAGWQFALEPSDSTHLQAAVSDMYRHGVTGIGLLIPDDASGEAAAAALARFLAVDTMRVVTEARFDPRAEAITPEALRVAAREPGAILAWGDREAAVRGLEALRARGWRGPVYLPGDVATGFGGGPPAALEGDARLAVPPAVVPGAVEPTDPRASWIADARSLAGGRVGSAPFAADAAVLHDALVLLALGFERASVYGVSSEDVRSFRLALRDALVSLGPVELAAGSYDPRMDRPDAALASGLVLARLDGGRLEPVP